MAAGPYLVTRGIVLRDTDTRDADKILTLLTAEQGKIAVIARGARRKGCKFAACAQPLAYSGVDAHKKGSGITPMKAPPSSCSTACGRNWTPWRLGSIWRS